MLNFRFSPADVVIRSVVDGFSLVGFFISCLFSFVDFADSNVDKKKESMVILSYLKCIV